MGMLMRRHRLQDLQTKEAEQEVAEALLEAKHKLAEASEDKPKKLSKKNEG
jgi:hypothetical protein